MGDNDQPPSPDPLASREPLGVTPYPPRPPNLVTVLDVGKTDDQIAADLRVRLSAAVQVMVEVGNEARKHGFYVEYGIQLDQFGKYFAGPIGLVKRF